MAVALIQGKLAPAHVPWKIDQLDPGFEYRLDDSDGLATIEFDADDFQSWREFRRDPKRRVRAVFERAVRLDVRTSHDRQSTLIFDDEYDSTALDAWIEYRNDYVRYWSLTGRCPNSYFYEVMPADGLATTSDGARHFLICGDAIAISVMAERFTWKWLD